MPQKWTKKLILAYFGPEINVLVQNDHSILKPLLCLKEKIMNRFSDNCKSLLEIGILANLSSFEAKFQPNRNI